jgi:y4mF family transcriptional regulator
MSYVYVVTNDWCPGLSKLGATENIEQRFNDLRGVLPGSSILRWFKNVEDCFVIESLARSALAELAIPGSRDWFNCPHEVIVRQFEAIIDRREPALVVKKLEARASQKIDKAGNLGLYCRTIRARHELTQGELAALAGVGIRFVSEFENGKETCEIGKVLQVVSTLGIDVFAVRRVLETEVELQKRDDHD